MDAHHRFRRIVGIDRPHRGAVDHDVGEFELAEIEHATEAVTVGLHHRSLAVQQIDGATQLLMRRQHRCLS
ncbi:hypothetical protein ACVIRM_000475 [Rhizobium laguerreae]